MTIEDMQPVAAQDMDRQIVAVSYDMKRDIFPSGKDEKGNIKALACGMTTNHIILKTPSGKHFACPCPEELIIDLWHQDEPNSLPKPEDVDQG
jgi:hypothetical protein